MGEIRDSDNQQPWLNLPLRTQNQSDKANQPDQPCCQNAAPLPTENEKEVNKVDTPHYALHTWWMYKGCYLKLLPRVKK